MVTKVLICCANFISNCVVVTYVALRREGLHMCRVQPTCTLGFPGVHLSDYSLQRATQAWKAGHMAQGASDVAWSGSPLGRPQLLRVGLRSSERGPESRWTLRRSRFVLPPDIVPEIRRRAW